MRDQKKEAQDLGGDERPRRSLEPSPVQEDQLSHAEIHQRAREAACFAVWRATDVNLSNGHIAMIRAAVDATLAAVRAESPQKPLDHYWTPDPTKRFCVVCGDNGLGSVWGIHRFQIQPHDPDFKEIGSGTQATHGHSDSTRRSEAK